MEEVEIEAPKGDNGGVQKPVEGRIGGVSK